MTDVAREIIALEEGALARWVRGDRRGYIELYVPDVTYFAESLPGRVDGVDALRELFSPLNTDPPHARTDIVNPRVEVVGDVAWMTCQIDDFDGAGDRLRRWNLTEIYRSVEGEWKIAHSHWSIVPPDKVD